MQRDKKSGIIRIANIYLEVVPFRTAVQKGVHNEKSASCYFHSVNCNRSIVDSTGKIVGFIDPSQPTSGTRQATADPISISVQQTVDALISPTPNEKDAASLIQTRVFLTLAALTPTVTQTLNPEHLVSTNVSSTINALQTVIAATATASAKQWTPTSLPTKVPPTPIPPTAVLPTAVVIPCGRMSFVGDVSVPDETVFKPNQGFQKIWRIQNTGSCTWTPAYQFVFVSGDQMNAPASVALLKNVQPGETIDITVNMVAPKATGRYKGYWRMRDPNGVLYGMGKTGHDAVWVDIWVQGVDELPTIPTLPAQPLPPAPLSSPVSPPPPAKGCIVTNAYIDMWVDGRFTAIATVKNTGSKTWNKDVFVVAHDGSSESNSIYEYTFYSLDKSVGYGDTITLRMDGYDSNKGKYNLQTFWYIRNPDENWESYCEFSTKYH